MSDTDKEYFMNITVLSYHDQALIDQVNAQAAARAQAEREKAAQEAAAASLSSSQSFSAALDTASQGYTAASQSALSSCPADLEAIFQEASSLYGVSCDLLKSIAKAESGFNPNAVSHAGAVGIMQLMPGTAASLGVTNSYDPRENILGGAKLMAQLLSRYNGNTALALAAYNAGSGNVDKYGGIPPFTETQNYVRKVLSYLGSGTDSLSSLTGALTGTGSTSSTGNATLDLMVALLKYAQSEHEAAERAKADAAQPAPAPVINVTVINPPADSGQNPAPDTNPAGTTDDSGSNVDPADKNDGSGTNVDPTDTNDGSGTTVDPADKNDGSDVTDPTVNPGNTDKNDDSGAVIPTDGFGNTGDISPADGTDNTDPQAFRSLASIASVL